VAATDSQGRAAFKVEVKTMASRTDSQRQDDMAHGIPERQHRDLTPSTDDLFRRWRTDRDQRARDTLVDRFLPLARRLAARYRGPNEPLEDLVQVACVGLLSAIDRFDPERGIQFRRFAIPTILGELRRHFRDTGWTAHVPRGAQELALQIDGAVRALTVQDGREPGPARVAEFLELDLADVLVGFDARTAHFSKSLDAPVARAGGPGSSEILEPYSLIDTLGHGEDGYHLIDAKLSLQDEIRRLPHRERVALQLRMQCNLKQSEIAEQMNCSQMQVSRLLRRAQTSYQESINTL
jgi:RNA polymerase sigma-B factor